MALDCTSSNVSDEWKLLTGSSPFFISAGVFFFSLLSWGRWKVGRCIPACVYQLVFSLHLLLSRPKIQSPFFSRFFYIKIKKKEQKCIFEQRFNDRSWSRKFRFWRLFFVCFVPIGGFFGGPRPVFSSGRSVCAHFHRPTYHFLLTLPSDNWWLHAVGSWLDDQKQTY